MWFWGLGLGKITDENAYLEINRLVFFGQNREDENFLRDRIGICETVDFELGFTADNHSPYHGCIVGLELELRALQIEVIAVGAKLFGIVRYYCPVIALVFRVLCFKVI
jgi:hypothetical protein